MIRDVVCTSLSFARHMIRGQQFSGAQKKLFAKKTVRNKNEIKKNREKNGIGSNKGIEEDTKRDKKGQLCKREKKAGCARRSKSSKTKNLT